MIENALNDEESGVSEPIYTEGFCIGGAAEIGDLNDVGPCLCFIDMTNGLVESADRTLFTYLEIEVEGADDLCPRGLIYGDSFNG